MLTHRIRLALLAAGVVLVACCLPVAFPLWKCSHTMQLAMAPPWFVSGGHYYEFPLGVEAREAPGVFTSHSTHPLWGYSLYFYPDRPFRLQLGIITAGFRLFWVLSLLSVVLLNRLRPSRTALLAPSVLAIAIGIFVPSVFRLAHYWSSLAGAGDAIAPHWHLYVQRTALLLSLPAMPVVVYLPDGLVDQSFAGGIFGTIILAVVLAATWFTVLALVPVTRAFFLGRARRRA